MNYSFKLNCHLLMVGLLGALVFLLASCYELAPFPGFDAGGGDGDADGDTDTDTDENPQGLSCEDGVACYSSGLETECQPESHDLHVTNQRGTCADDTDGVGQCYYGTTLTTCASPCSLTQYCPDNVCQGIECAYQRELRYCDVDDVLHGWNGLPGECVGEGGQTLGCEFGESIRSCGAGKCVDNPDKKGDKMCKDAPCDLLLCGLPPASYCLDDHTVANFEEIGTCFNGVCEYELGAPTDCQAKEPPERCLRGTCKE